MSSIDPVTEYQTDHDIIVGLSRDLKHFGEDIRELKDAVTKKNDDHETRLRNAETDITTMKSSQTMWRYILSSAISIVGLAVAIIGLILANS